MGNGQMRTFNRLAEQGACSKTIVSLNCFQYFEEFKLAKIAILANLANIVPKSLNQSHIVIIGLFVINQTFQLHPVLSTCRPNMTDGV